MPSEEIPPLPDDPPSGSRLLGRAALVLVGVVAAAGLLLALLVAAGHEPRLRDVPITLVGPPSQTGPGRDALEGLQDGRAYDVRTSRTFAPALESLREREVRAVQVLRADGSQKLYVASAGGKATADLLRVDFLTGAREAGRGTRSRVSDVVPVGEHDLAGATAFGLALGWVLGGWLGALALALAAPGAPVLARLGLLLAFCLALGALGAVVADPLFDALPGHLAALALVGALACAAVALPTLGLHAVLGRPGAVLAALVLVVVGLTTTGGTDVPEALPEPLRSVGPVLPAANAVDLVRGVASFGDAGTGDPLLLLGVYAAAGLLVALAGGRLLRSRG